MKSMSTNMQTTQTTMKEMVGLIGPDQVGNSRALDIPGPGKGRSSTWWKNWGPQFVTSKKSSTNEVLYSGGTIRHIDGKLCRVDLHSAFDIPPLGRPPDSSRHRAPDGFHTVTNPEPRGSEAPSRSLKQGLLVGIAGTGSEVHLEGNCFAYAASGTSSDYDMQVPSQTASLRPYARNRASSAISRTPHPGSSQFNAEDYINEVQDLYPSTLVGSREFSYHMPVSPHTCATRAGDSYASSDSHIPGSESENNLDRPESSYADTARDVSLLAPTSLQRSSSGTTPSPSASQTSKMECPLSEPAEGYTTNAFPRPLFAEPQLKPFTGLGAGKRPIESTLMPLGSGNSVSPRTERKLEDDILSYIGGYATSSDECSSSPQIEALRWVGHDGADQELGACEGLETEVDGHDRIECWRSNVTLAHFPEGPDTIEAGNRELESSRPTSERSIDVLPGAGEIRNHQAVNGPDLEASGLTRLPHTTHNRRCRSRKGRAERYEDLTGDCAMPDCAEGLDPQDEIRRLKEEVAAIVSWPQHASKVTNL
ncbi:hypothetical protein DRE_02936 [Drechslerella stenobrocha 248]|uniref:Uncharacterized protein n=1 Tax=Drechslerella stenobrocha 248 TaxID=1043628 RepID=W7HU72_9PEZI|nr:hypothetical protein DRE_02936 [Drechslerella stenobrocha 248]